MSGSANPPSLPNPLNDWSNAGQIIPRCRSSVTQGPQSKRPLRLRLLPIYVRLESMNVHATGLACPQTLSSTIFGRGQVVSGDRACTLGLLSPLLAIGCRA